jgi:hypothetical protein
MGRAIGETPLAHVSGLSAERYGVDLRSVRREDADGFPTFA